MIMMMMVPSIPNDTQSLLYCTLAFMAENRALFRFTMIPPGLYNPPPSRNVVYRVFLSFTEIHPKSGLYNPLLCYKGIARSRFLWIWASGLLLCIWVRWCGGEKEFGSRVFLQRGVMWIACAWDWLFPKGRRCALWWRW
jgi:hypothetical protein